MFSGFGAGNCWYMGRDNSVATTNKHMFRCNNMGAVAANTEMSLAFQFTVRNQGKDMGIDGLLAKVVTSLSCVLTLRTRQGTNTKTEWFTQTIANDVDGGSAETTWSVFDEYWARPIAGVYTFGQSAQSAAAVMNAGATTGTGVDVTAYVQLSPSDQIEHATLTNSSTVGAALKYRKFPWDSLSEAIGAATPYAAASALSFSAFGHASASPLATTRISPTYLRVFKSDGTWDDTSASGVGSAFTSLTNAEEWSGMTVPTATFSTLAPDSANAASGQLLFSTSTWGGTCGAARATASATGQMCSARENPAGIDPFQYVISSVDTNRKIYIHAGAMWQSTSATDFNQVGTIGSWSWADTSGKFFAQGTSLFAWTLTQGGTETDAFFTPATASFSAFRGRGGFGSASGQYVTQRFLKLYTGISGAGHLQNVVQHYIFPTSAMTPSAGLKVAPSFPLW